MLVGSPGPSTPRCRGRDGQRGHGTQPQPLSPEELAQDRGHWGLVEQQRPGCGLGGQHPGPSSAPLSCPPASQPPCPRAEQVGQMPECPAPHRPLLQRQRCGSPGALLRMDGWKAGGPGTWRLAPALQFPGTLVLGTWLSLDTPRKLLLWDLQRFLSCTWPCHGCSGHDSGYGRWHLAGREMAKLANSRRREWWAVAHVTTVLSTPCGRNAWGTLQVLGAQKPAEDREPREQWLCLVPGECPRSPRSQRAS